MKMKRFVLFLLTFCLCACLLPLSVFADETGPEAPAVTASNVASSGKIKLTWDAVEGAVKYKVYRSDSEDGTYKLMKTAASTSYTNTSAAAGNTYYYYVVAVDSEGNVSEASKTVARTCDLPRPVVTASNVASSGKIKLTWEAVDGAVSYKVYRATTKTGTYKLMKTVTTPSYTNTTAAAGTTYYYKVKAIASNTAANSAYSSVDSRTCDLPRPVVSISNVAASGKIKLTWEAVDGAVSYEVYRCDSKDGTYKRMKTVTSPSYINTTAVAGNTYYYKVKAIASKSAANSAYSSYKSRTCDLPRPEVSIALNSKGYPRLTWEAVDGAVSYKVYRSTSREGTYTLMKTATGTSYTNTSAKSGTVYYYKVVAVAEKSAANSAESKVVFATAGGLVTCYVSQTQITIYKSPDSSSTSRAIPYMAEVQLGEAVYSWTSGSWRKVYYEGDLYYVWIAAGTEKFTMEKSPYIYNGRTVFQQEVIDLATEIALEWNTVYTHGQSNGVMNDDGTYGFDCSGFATYVLNTVMQKRVPVFKLTAVIAEFYATESVINKGYDGEYIAVDVELEDIQPGDVLFFSLEDENDHCGIYLGDGEFAHSCRTWEKSVVIAPLEGSYGDRLNAIRRYLPEPEDIVPANATVYTTGYCKLYKERNSDSTVLRNFKPSEAVTLLYTNSDNWAYVRTDDGTEAFMLTRFLTDTP